MLSCPTTDSRIQGLGSVVSCIGNDNFSISLRSFPRLGTNVTPNGNEVV